MNGTVPPSSRRTAVAMTCFSLKSSSWETLRIWEGFMKKNGEAGIRTLGPGSPGQLLSRQLRSATPAPLQNLIVLHSFLLTLLLKKLTDNGPAFAGQDPADNINTMVQPLMPNDVHQRPDRKSTRLNSSHSSISYAVFCLKK